MKHQFVTFVESVCNKNPMLQKAVLDGYKVYCESFDDELGKAAYRPKKKYMPTIDEELSFMDDDESMKDFADMQFDSDKEAESNQIVLFNALDSHGYKYMYMDTDGGIMIGADNFENKFGLKVVCYRNKKYGVCGIEFNDIDEANGKIPETVIMKINDLKNKEFDTVDELIDAIEQFHSYANTQY